MERNEHMAGGDDQACARQLVVIGGSDAGTMAALRARDLDPTVDVTMVVADRYPSFSVCGLPFYISGGGGGLARARTPLSR